MYSYDRRIAGTKFKYMRGYDGPSYSVARPPHTPLWEDDFWEATIQVHFYYGEEFDKAPPSPADMAPDMKALAAVVEGVYDDADGFFNTEVGKQRWTMDSVEVNFDMTGLLYRLDLDRDDSDSEIEKKFEHYLKPYEAKLRQALARVGIEHW